MLYPIIKKILFQLPPETSHHVALESLRYTHLLGLTKLLPKITAPKEVMGLRFPNSVGLAAGLDKSGDYFEALSALGFGFVEIGSITPKPQQGNPKPRLFRLEKQSAIINRMGFNNQGLDYAEAQLQKSKFKGILGINIGKNKDTPLEKAADDYLEGFRRMAPYASYITVNISSPNTPGLRDLQQGDLLQSLLKTLKQAQSQLTKYVPLVVKVAPDLTLDEVHHISDILLTEKIDGLIATNTTVSREGVEESLYANEVGGLSGRPLCSRSTAIVKAFHEKLTNKIPIIACGGIFSAQDALEKHTAGACLFQVYTGFIYRGPSLINEIARLNFS